MAKAKLRVTKETRTGRNIEFQDTRNHKKMSNKELINRLSTGNSAYNDDYCIKHDKNGNKYVASKPDNNTNNNFG